MSKQTSNRRRDEMATGLLAVFLQLSKPSTFSSVGWEQSVRESAERAVRAADILCEELDGVNRSVQGE